MILIFFSFTLNFFLAYIFLFGTVYTTSKWDDNWENYIVNLQIKPKSSDFVFRYGVNYETVRVIMILQELVTKLWI